MCSEEHVFLFWAHKGWIVLGCCSSGFHLSDCLPPLFFIFYFCGGNSTFCLRNSSPIPCGSDEPANLCPHPPRTCHTQSHGHMVLAGMIMTTYGLVDNWLSSWNASGPPTTLFGKKYVDMARERYFSCFGIVCLELPVAFSLMLIKFLPGEWSRQR